MRIGAALTMTLNLPFRKIQNANLGVRKNGTGTIALEMSREEPGRIAPVLRDDLAPCAAVADEAPEPALRCIPDAAKVARLFSEAAETAVSQPVIEVPCHGPTARPSRRSKRHGRHTSLQQGRTEAGRTRQGDGADHPRAAMFLLCVCVLIIVGYARLTDRPLSAMPPSVEEAPVVMERVRSASSGTWTAPPRSSTWTAT
jgi:hypothetical protein